MVQESLLGLCPVSVARSDLLGVGTQDQNLGIYGDV